MSEAALTANDSGSLVVTDSDTSSTADASVDTGSGKPSVKQQIWAVAKKPRAVLAGIVMHEFVGLAWMSVAWGLFYKYSPTMALRQKWPHLNHMYGRAEKWTSSRISAMRQNPAFMSGTGSRVDWSRLTTAGVESCVFRRMTAPISYPLKLSLALWIAKRSSDKQERKQRAKEQKAESKKQSRSSDEDSTTEEASSTAVLTSDEDVTIAESEESEEEEAEEEGAEQPPADSSDISGFLVIDLVANEPKNTLNLDDPDSDDQTGEEDVNPVMDTGEQTSDLSSDVKTIVISDSD